MANSVDPDQTAPIGAVCSGSTLFSSIPNWPVMPGNYLQQTTSAEDIFRCIFFLTLYQGLKLTLCPMGNFSCFFVVCFFFFQKQHFGKIISGIPSEYQSDWIQIRTDVLSGLIWVQSVCKGYEQTTLVGNELMKEQNSNNLRHRS